MKNHFKSPSKVRVHWKRVVGVMIAVFIVAETFLAFGKRIALERHIHARLVASETEMHRLQEENLTLRKEKEALYRQEKIEQLAREELGLTRPNEIAIKIIKNPNFDAQNLPKNTHASQKNVWTRIWKKIKEATPIQWLLKLGPS